MINRCLTVSLFVLAAFFASEASAAKRPNILFAIADDASYPHMGAYGTEWTATPSFDRVAREGLLFTRCYTPNAKCAPSRSCILTGRNSWQLKAAANHWCRFPLEFASFVEALGGNGYTTGMTGKGWAPGVALDAKGNRREMTGASFGKHREKPPTGGISANDYAANFDDFLATTSTDTPFFFWYGATEPHRRYEYGSGVAKGGKSIDQIKQVPEYWPDNEVVRNDMLDYAFEIEHFDDHLGRMIERLEKVGRLDNTIIVVTSDNGMPFPRVKGNAYEASNHLPLAIMWPAGIEAPGRTVGDFVSFIDFAPTFLEVAQVDWNASSMSPTPGRSMMGIFKNSNAEPHRDYVLIGKERHDLGRPGDTGYPIRGIVQGSFVLIKNFETSRWPSGNPETGYLNTDGSPTKSEVLEDRRDGSNLIHWQQCFGIRPELEMYNVETDPACIKNLVDDPAYAAEKRSMTATMERELLDQQDPRMLGNGDVFDAYPNADKKNAGFYEKYTKDKGNVKAGWVNESDFESSPIRIEPSIRTQP